MNETYFTVREIAEKFRVSRQAIYDWIEAGQLKAVRVGRRVRIPESALADFARPIEPGEKIEDDEEPTT